MRYSLLLSALFLFLCPLFSGFAQENPLTCLERRKEDFFPYSIVAQAFSLNRIDQSLWTPIVAELQRRSQEVPRRMGEQSARYIPNPFIYPYNESFIKKLWLHMLLQIFTETMHSYQIGNSAIIQNTFNYIKENHLRSFDSCFPRAEEKKVEK